MIPKLRYACHSYWQTLSRVLALCLGQILTSTSSSVSKARLGLKAPPRLRPGFSGPGLKVFEAQALSPRKPQALAHQGPLQCKDSKLI